MDTLATTVSLRSALSAYRSALYAGDLGAARKALSDVCSPDAVFRLSHPFSEAAGAESYCDIALKPLFDALPDIEARDWLVMAGRTEHGDDWVGCGGTFLGTFETPFLDIPPTGHIAHMRYHEFFRFEGGRVVEVHALWDIPELMIQAGAWPMSPSLGREWHVPGPASQDGLSLENSDPSQGAESCRTIVDMLAAMKRHPSEGGPELMELERFWHPKMTWYGPAGIGTGRGIAGFRNWHQIPFLNAMPDRGRYADQVLYHFFGEGPYAAVTGWPNMIQTISADGWLGIAPANQRITMSSLDFWRIEDGFIRENWVMVDLMDMYRQIGVDVLMRMREFNKARAGFDKETGRAMKEFWQ